MATGEMARYDSIYSPGHPRATDNHVLAHVLVVERAMGKYLRKGAAVHHIDGNERNNAPSNLVACHDNTYHLMLHNREKALKACGHATWRKCVRCHQYEDPVNLSIDKANKSARHKACENLYQRKRRKL